LLESWIKPDDPRHDSAIQLLALLLAIGLCLLANALQAPLSGTTAFLIVMQGLLGGAGSIGVYHVAKAGSNALAAGTAPADAPPPAQAEKAVV
jgi:hypothetical protein